MSIIYKIWDICIANVFYEEINISKPRPILILEDNDETVKCIKMTSKPARHKEYILTKWKESGLHVETVVRIGKILKLRKNSIHKKIGELAPIDIIGIQKAIIEFYKK